MSLAKLIAKNTSAQIVGKVISTLLGIIAIMIMTRGLGLEKFGWYSTAIGFMQFIGLLSDFGFTVTTANMLAEAKYDKQRLLNTIFSWRLLTALVAHGLAVIAILFFPYPTEIKIAVLIISISFFAIALNQVFTGYFQAYLKTYNIAIADIIGRSVLVIGTFLAIYYHTGFYSVITVITLASLVNSWYLKTQIKNLKLSFDRVISQALFIKIWPNALAVIFNSFYLQGDRFLLPLYINQSEVALYGASYRILDISVQTAAIAMGIMMPLLTHSWAQNNLPEFKSRYHTSFTIVALLLFPIITAVFVLAEPIIRFIASTEFSSASSILRLLNWAVLGISFGMVFGHAVLAINRQRQALWIYLSDAIISVIAYLIFIPRYGLIGAAGVTIFSEVYASLGLFGLVFYYTRTLPPFKIMAKIAMASITMGIVVSYIKTWPLALVTIIGMLVYFLLILALKILKKQTILHIFQKEKLFL